MALVWKAGWVNSPQGFESPILRQFSPRPPNRSPARRIRPSQRAHRRPTDSRSDMRAIGRTVWVVSLITAGLVVGPAALAEPAYSCDGRPATIVAQSPPGARGPVRVAGTAGDDVIYVPDDGWDEVTAGHGNDLVCGYPDLTYGGTGADTIESTFGQDITTFTAYGEEGDDTLVAHPTATRTS